MGGISTATLGKEALNNTPQPGPQSPVAGPLFPSSGLGRPIAQARLVPRGPATSDAPAGPSTGEEGQSPEYDGSFYAQVGGSGTFRKLTERFYAGVAADPEFRAMYPEEDLGPAAVRLQLFLEQYWGGPTTYSERRGHPRLRMRHMPYAVDSKARDTWLRHMRAALDSLELPPLQEATLWDYFDRAAHSLQNTPD